MKPGNKILKCCFADVPNDTANVWHIPKVDCAILLLLSTNRNAKPCGKSPIEPFIYFDSFNIALIFCNPSFRTYF